MEWDVKDMKLMSQKRTKSKGRVYLYEEDTSLSREEKIAFIDQFHDGKMTYILKLIEKYENEKDSLPQEKKWGMPKTVSFKAWIRRNNSLKMIDGTYDYGKIRFLKINKNIQRAGELAYLDSFEDIVDECFHRVMEECQVQEEAYFRSNDEYTVLKLQVLNRYHITTFGVKVITDSNNDIYIANEMGVKRLITLEELRQLTDGYKELDNMVRKMAKKFDITY